MDKHERRHRLRTRKLVERFADSPAEHPLEEPEELGAFLRHVGTPEEIEEKAQALLSVASTLDDAVDHGGFTPKEGEEISRAFERLGHRLDELKDLSHWALVRLEDQGLRYNADRERVETASGMKLVTRAVADVFSEAELEYGGWDFSRDFTTILRRYLAQDYPPEALTHDKLKSALQYLKRRDRIT